MRMAQRSFLFLGALCAAASAPRPHAEVFGPGTISTGEYESHPAFSRDGELLFVRSDSNFSKWSIWESRRTRAGWSRPVPAPFAEGDIAADPYFAPDGRHVYFISARTGPGKTQHDLNIWMVERRASGWGAPERLPAPVNSPGAQWFPRVQKDGSLYFGSDRPGGLGHTDIYRAWRTARAWQVANIGAPVNGAGDEYEFEVSPTGDFAILMADRDPKTGGDLYLVRRKGAGWSTPHRLGPEINTSKLEVGPLISSDGKQLYFSSRRSDTRLGDIYRVTLSWSGEQ
jgi:Tol biopolymer transport system component